MISSEVQRTLVKSPPELWAELSDPASLARHLGELGEVRITRVEPERTVEWEAAETTGKVLLKASGWGTKVTLTVAREVGWQATTAEPGPEAATPVIDPEAASETGADNEVEPEPRPTTEPELANVVEVETEIETEAEPVATAEPQPELGPESEAVVEEPVQRRGFFARLFGRRPKEQAPPESPAEPVAAAEPVSPVEPELVIVPEPEPVEEPEQEPTVASRPDTEHETPSQDAPPEDLPPEEVPDIAAELLAAEEAANAEVTAVLTAVLDRLGAAHHRPFSRA